MRMEGVTDLRCVLMSRQGRETERCGDRETGLRLLWDGAGESGLGSWAHGSAPHRDEGGNRVAPVLHGQRVRCQSMVHSDWLRSLMLPTHPLPLSPRRKGVDSLLCGGGD